MRRDLLQSGHEDRGLRRRRTDHGRPTVETHRAKTEHPSVFLRVAESQVGHGQSILCPRESTMLDYEGEIAIVIGKPPAEIPKTADFSNA